ncbi:hypothetical protein NE237_025685 [Protea cynaroides]|uniref:Non-haem dioxygenase N-terminal domain-containing protein n=1 Tax=Protea cynaroides TaxID=273540 RepID=A0A9Q0H3L3_9MAGN|nr:hypothetical protein NE237_025685 [Protea cynaroides]
MIAMECFCHLPILNLLSIFHYIRRQCSSSPAISLENTGNDGAGVLNSRESFRHFLFGSGFVIESLSASTLIPTDDLSGFELDHRANISDQICDASSKTSSFQIANHGIPSKFVDRTVAGIKAFYEQAPSPFGSSLTSAFSSSAIGASSFFLETNAAMRNHLDRGFSAMTRSSNPHQDPLQISTSFPPCV